MTHDAPNPESNPQRVSRCSNCQHTFTYPRLHCARCGSLSISSKPVDGQGTIYSVTTVRVHPDPVFRALVPYDVAYIDLDGGGRILARLTGQRSTAAKIGDRVQVSSTDSIAPLVELESSAPSAQLAAALLATKQVVR